MTQILVSGQRVRVLLLGVATSALLALSLPTAAQTLTATERDAAQRDAAEQQRQRERLEQDRKRQEATPDINLPTPSTAAQTLPTNETPCFVIHQISLEGEGAYPFTWVLDHLGGPQNTDSPNDSPLRKCLGAKGIGVLLQRAQDALIAKGFVTSRILAQPQDLSQGQLRLTLIPGRVNAIRFQDAANSAPANKDANHPATNLSTAVPTREGRILNLRDIEQGLENLKRVPTADADIQITPANQPDASDLVVSYQHTRPLRGSLGVDDAGAKSTGKYQGNATLSWDNPLHLNDLFYFTAGHDLGGGDPGERGTRSSTLHYEIPLGYWDIGFTATDSRYYQTVVGTSQNYTYSGTSGSAELKLGHLLWRDSTSKTSAYLKAFERHSRNTIDDTEVQVQRRATGGWEVGLSHKRFVGSSTWEGAVAYKGGTGDFDSRAAPEQALGEGTSQFVLWTADLSLSHPFNVGKHPLRYQGSLHVQGNDTPLTPQDRMAIGGRYTVRGFDGENSLSGDSAYLIRNEWSAPLGASAQSAYLAIDAGEVGGRSTAGLPGRNLAGMAVGLRGAYKQLQYDLFVGAPLDKPSGFKTSDTTAGFSLNMSF